MNKRIVSLILCLMMILSIIPLSSFSVLAGGKPVVTVEHVQMSAYRGKFCEVILNVDCDEEATYQWQAGFVDGYFDMVDLPESDVYKGVNTNHFRLKAVGDLWQLDFRCKITYSGGTIYTDRFIFMFLDNLPVETAQVTGIEKPKFGYTPDLEVDQVDSYKYQIGDVEWYGPNYDGDGWVKMNSTDVFAEADYKCRIYLEPLDTYAFTEDSLVLIDGMNYTVTKTLNEESEDIFYTERVYYVRFDDTIPEGLLDFESRTPDTEETEDYYLGTCYLGTDSMNQSFSFKSKALPMNMYKAGYYIAENTRIANVKNESLYYENHGRAVNFADYAKEKGKYYVEQTIYLMSHEDERIASKEASYVIDVFEPQEITSAGITFNAFNTWTKPFYTYVARTPEIKFNTMFWYDVTDGKSQINNGDAFIGGHTYRMEIWIDAVDGYVFYVDEEGNPDFTAKVNGMDAKSVSLDSSTKAKIAFEFTYEGENTQPSLTGLLGDSDCDGKVNVKDATAIQKHVAGIITLSETGAKLADVDTSTNINIKDATAIQKWVAGIETGFAIGSTM